MECNVGGVDRGVRIVIGILLLLLTIGLGIYSQIVGILAALIGLIMLVTGVSGYCPLYKITKTNTCKRS